jgi:hypothetical protein
LIQTFWLIVPPSMYLPSGIYESTLLKIDKCKSRAFSSMKPHSRISKTSMQTIDAFIAPCHLQLNYRYLEQAHFLP